jgi:hypothetical protein
LKQSAQALGRNPAQQNIAKHIDVKSFSYITGSDICIMSNVTKPLPKEKFDMQGMGIRES